MNSSIDSVRVCVALEHRFFRCEDIVYTRLAFDYSYWTTYLSVFSNVAVFARVLNVDRVDSNYVTASGPSVQFYDCPYYIGPAQLAGMFGRVLLAAFKFARLEGVFLLRSGNVSNMLWLCLSVRRKKFLREFPGDISAGVAGFVGGEGLRHQLANRLGRMLSGFGKIQARRAIACGYVSESVRKIYPARNSAAEFIFSGVQLPPSTIAKRDYNLGKCVRVVSVGRLENEKGHVVLVRALASALAASNNLSISLCLIGSGSRAQEIKQLAASLNLSVDMKGGMTDKYEMFQKISEADVFVLPSLTEGMPRSLLEAIVIGVPVIGSNVGGVPEILPSSNLFEAGSESSLRFSLSTILKMSAKEREAQSEELCGAIKERYSVSRQATVRSEFWQQGIQWYVSRGARL